MQEVRWFRFVDSHTRNTQGNIRENIRYGLSLFHEFVASNIKLSKLPFLLCFLFPCYSCYYAHKFSTRLLYRIKIYFLKAIRIRRPSNLIETGSVRFLAVYTIVIHDFARIRNKGMKNIFLLQTELKW